MGMQRTASDMNAADYHTLGEVLEHHSAVRPHAVATVFEGQLTSYRDLHSRSKQVAAALSATETPKGKRIVYMGKNCGAFFELLFGAALCGAVLTPVGWRLTGDEAAYIIEDSATDTIFVGPEGEQQLEAALRIVSRELDILSINDGSYAAWRDLIGNLTIHLPDENDVVLQLYTSGTTGRPKGVTLTHRNLQSAKRLPDDPNLKWGNWSEADVCLDCMPVSHIAGTNLGLMSIVAGARLIILRDFDTQSALDAIKNEGVTVLFLVPAALRLVLQNPEAKRIDYSRLNYILYGASPIPLDLLRACIKVFGCGFCQQYGMTETTGTVTYIPPSDHSSEGTERMRSAGVAMPGVQLRTVDDAGLDVGPGQVGEILIRSPMNTPGYWNRPDDTASAIDPEGWLRTGDAGYLDCNGYLFIQDRVKDMIITGGENVYPAEVESAIFGHPAVSDVAVIGVPNDKWGEAVKAIVVIKEGSQVTPDEIISFARSRIARFKCPKSVDFLGELPRNASGKILRRELRVPYWKDSNRQVG